MNRNSQPAWSAPEGIVLHVVEPEGRQQQRVARLQRDVEARRRQPREEREAGVVRLIKVDLRFARARVGVMGRGACPAGGQPRAS